VNAYLITYGIEQYVLLLVTKRTVSNARIVCVESHLIEVCIIPGSGNLESIDLARCPYQLSVRTGTQMWFFLSSMIFAGYGE
jgi:hypothetical protein